MWEVIGIDQYLKYHKPMLLPFKLYFKNLKNSNWWEFEPISHGETNQYSIHLSYSLITSGEPASI